MVQLDYTERPVSIIMSSEHGLIRPRITPKSEGQEIVIALNVLNLDWFSI